VGCKINAFEQGFEIEDANARMKGLRSMKGPDKKKETRREAPDV
jgi:hypothetical protein